MKKYIFLLFLLFTAVSLQAQYPLLSKDAEISLLTVSPSEDEVYTVYGHTALRVRDASKKLDTVFNYGIFDFSKPNFIYRFAKGETDYRLAAQYTRDFLIEYEMRGSEVTEQILDIDSAGKARIWEALMINNRPENRVYRYNFFFDNCATRPAAIIWPAAPAATAAVAPKPRNARRLSLVSFMSLSPFDEKRVGFPLPASSRGFPVWNPPLRCQPYAPASLPATPAGGWFFAFRPVRSPPDTGRVSDRMPDGTVYEYAFAVAGAVLGLEP